VDEALVSELESAIADSGALLLQLQKYRRGREREGTGLAREAMALGDAARRLHRRDALGGAAVSDLLAEARGVTARLRALIDAVRADPAYRAAVTAHRTGDHAALGRLLPVIFAGLEPFSAAGDLFAPIAWLRRGRLRPVADVVDDVQAGLPAEGDDLSPGADADLPAVSLSDSPPPDEPIVLRLPAGTLAGPVHRLSESGEVLVHVPRLPAPAAVVRLATRLELDEQLRVEVAPAEYAHHRDALEAALTAAGVPIERV
jgi:hypothetical protein